MASVNTCTESIHSGRCSESGDDDNANDVQDTTSSHDSEAYAQVWDDTGEMPGLALQVSCDVPPCTHAETAQT